eukprot:c24559_g1_i1 orf=5-1312(+)
MTIVRKMEGGGAPPPPPLQASLQRPPCSASQALQRHLSRLFAGRGSEIRQLLCLLGEPHECARPLLVYGGASTGKTSVVMEVFKQLRRPFAYVSCRSCHNPRILFESLLNQLAGHGRTADNNYCSVKKCDKLLEFVEYLPEACRQARARNTTKCMPFTIQPQKEPAPGCCCSGSNDCEMGNVATGRNSLFHGESSQDESDLAVVYLIFDNAQMMLSWTGGFRLISGLLRLSEYTRLRNLGLIFISNVGPDAFFSGTGTLQPLPVYFRDYTDEELFQILLRGKIHADLYSSFLGAVLKPFSRATRRVTELSQALEPLFQKYLEPVLSGVVKPDEQGKRKLFFLLKPYISSALNLAFCFSDIQSQSFPSGATIDKGGKRRSLMDINSKELDFEFSLCSKYLLLSAFVCSRNRPTLDATLFDSGGGVGSKKRRRKQVS